MGQTQHAGQSITPFEPKCCLQYSFAFPMVFIIDSFVLPSAREIQCLARDGRVHIAAPSVNVPYEPLATAVIKSNVIAMQAGKALRSACLRQPVIDSNLRCRVGGDVSLVALKS
jgi:hypothetical protein